MAGGAASARVPAVQRLGDAVLLQGPAVHDVAFLIGLGIRFRAQVDGCPPSHQHKALLAYLTDVSVSMPVPTSTDAEHANVRESPDSRDYKRNGIGTAEAARLLGFTEQHVRRLATHLGGQRVRGAWVFDRAAIAAEVARRSEGNHR